MPSCPSLISQHAFVCPLTPIPSFPPHFYLILLASSAPADSLSLPLCSLLTSPPSLSSIFTLVNLLIPLSGVWLRCCECVRMAVSRSNPWELALIFASITGQCLSVQSLSQAIIKLLAVTGDKTVSLSQKPIAHLSYRIATQLVWSAAKCIYVCMCVPPFNACKRQSKQIDSYF